MKLNNNLYNIISRNLSDSPISYVIQLDANHFIYKAHFPGEPITPGVCVLQIAKELLEDYLGKELNIQSVKNVKFLGVISPVEISYVKYVFEKVINDTNKNIINVQSLVLSDNNVLTKLSFTCIEK